MINLLKIGPSIKNLTEHLINLSFYCVPKALAIGEDAGQFSKTYAANDDSLVLIRTILNKYLDYTFSNKKG